MTKYFEKKEETDSKCAEIKEERNEDVQTDDKENEGTRRGWNGGKIGVEEGV